MESKKVTETGDQMISEDEDITRRIETKAKHDLGDEAGLFCCICCCRFFLPNSYS